MRHDVDAMTRHLDRIATNLEVLIGHLTNPQMVLKPDGTLEEDVMRPLEEDVMRPLEEAVRRLEKAARVAEGHGG